MLPTYLSSQTPQISCKMILATILASVDIYIYMICIYIYTHNMYIYRVHVYLFRVYKYIHVRAGVASSLPESFAGLFGFVFEVHLKERCLISGMENHRSWVTHGATSALKAPISELRQLSSKGLQTPKP